MQRHRFDDLTRRFATDLPRRRLLVALAAGLLGAPFGRAREAAAGCAKAGRKCDRNNDCCDRAACKRERCACKGGFDDCDGNCVKLANDEKHCGRCSRRCTGNETCCDGDCANVQTDADHCGSCSRRCGAGQRCVAGVCTTADGCRVGADSCSAGGRVECGDVPGCVCSPTTEGTTRCGAIFSPGSCGECESSDDCSGDAFCAIASGTSGPCCPDGENVCRLPCPVG